MNQNLELLCCHVISTLPDKISEREILLGAIIGTLPKDLAIRSDAQLLLRQLKEHQDKQFELSLGYLQK